MVCMLCGCQVEKGATAAVFGLGTIGLAVVDALRDAGAKRIIGVDTDPGKFERAKTWGATDLINPKDYDKPIQVCTQCSFEIQNSNLQGNAHGLLAKDGDKPVPVRTRR